MTCFDANHSIWCAANAEVRLKYMHWTTWHRRNRPFGVFPRMHVTKSLFFKWRRSKSQSNHNSAIHSRASSFSRCQSRFEEDNVPVSTQNLHRDSTTVATHPKSSGIETKIHDTSRHMLALINCLPDPAGLIIRTASRKGFVWIYGAEQS